MLLHQSQRRTPCGNDVPVGKAPQRFPMRASLNLDREAKEKGNRGTSPFKTHSENETYSFPFHITLVFVDSVRVWEWVSGDYLLLSSDLFQEPLRGFR